jgi:transposase InsO family protein
MGYPQARKESVLKKMLAKEEGISDATLYLWRCEKCSELASQLIHRGVIAEGSPPGLTTLHADNGAIQKSSTLRSKLEQLGIAPSFSRPRVSNDNAYAESLFKTLKTAPDIQ